VRVRHEQARRRASIAASWCESRAMDGIWEAAQGKPTFLAASPLTTDTLACQSNPGASESRRR
jgi:hypothetical protein